ncbi:hypothetical protein SteCoe_28906 [Stentor coeruleus]|uniref:Protein kinase domain-containing protein n=1 Tax=Stentor coeruleus TaxID=5963 RepID=A0A1R2B755_9CILI|nr:hypothetical protein SteCoe_28906 [Stentor coeruleus]
MKKHTLSEPYIRLAPNLKIIIPQRLSAPISFTQFKPRNNTKLPHMSLGYKKISTKSLNSPLALTPKSKVLTRIFAFQGLSSQHKNNQEDQFTKTIIPRISPKLSSENLKTKLEPLQSPRSLEMKGIRIKPSVKEQHSDLSTKNETVSIKKFPERTEEKDLDSSYGSFELESDAKGMKPAMSSINSINENKFNSPFVRKQTTKKSTVGSLISEHSLHNLQSFKGSTLNRECTIENLVDELNTTSSISTYNDLKIKLLDKDPMLESINGKSIQWRVMELLGSGGFGQVMKAINIDSGKIFAVKRIYYNPSNEIQQSFVDALIQEINILKNLKHKKIVKYIGSEVLEGNLCMYMEYLSGGSLAKLLYILGGLSEITVKAYARQILKGIQFLHENGIIHRDLKCDNILLDSSGKIKLCDFGCSKNYTDDLMESGGVMSVKGSLPWMAPEVMKEGGYGRKADIWSIGCVVLEMLTAKPPWNGTENQVLLMMKVLLYSEVPQIPNNISQECKDFLTKCLQRDPSLRPTAQELLKHPFVYSSKNLY